MKSDRIYDVNFPSAIADNPDFGLQVQAKTAALAKIKAYEVLAAAGENKAKFAAPKVKWLKEGTPTAVQTDDDQSALTHQPAGVSQSLAGDGIADDTDAAQAMLDGKPVSVAELSAEARRVCGLDKPNPVALGDPALATLDEMEPGTVIKGQYYEARDQGKYKIVSQGLVEEAVIEPGHHEQLDKLFGEGDSAPSASADTVEVEQGGGQQQGAGSTETIPQPDTIEWFEARLEHLKETLPYTDGKAYGQQKQAISELQNKILAMKRDQEPEINSHPEPVSADLMTQVHDALVAGELDPTHLLQLVAHLVEEDTLDPFGVAKGNIDLNLAMDGAMGGVIDD